jgi:predicted metalloprotease
MEPKELNIQIGKRLRQVRLMFNEGEKLSTMQFAYLLGESTERIYNYEFGRAGVPVRVLLELYNRGINPIYIISGEGDIFAPNKEGVTLKEKISKRKANLLVNKNEVKKINLNPKELDFHTKVIKVAAGKIKEKSKASEDNHHQPED